MKSPRTVSPHANVKHVDVHSSSLRSVGYNKETQELHVNFNDTGRYVYHGVPENVHQSLMMAASKGNFIHSQLKGKYEYTKL